MTLDCPLKPKFIQPISCRHNRDKLALCSSIYEGLKAVFVFSINEVDQGSIDPSSSLNAIQATHHDVELHVEIVVFFLDHAIMCSDGDSFHSLLDKLGCNLGFRLSDIVMTEEELAIEIGDIDCVYQS